MDVSPPIFDPAALKRNFADDTEFIRVLLEKFESRYPAQLAAIQDALSRGEGDAAADAAHQLAGEAGVFYAVASRHAALAVEDLARAGRIDQAMDAGRELGDKLDELAAAIRAVAGK